jgi:hypothetical protein
LIYRKDLVTHLTLLRLVLQILATHHVKVKQGKCKFPQPHLTYLGREISSDGVRTNPKNIQAVRKWTRPGNIKEVRGFLGLAGYCCKFVHDFEITSHPLTGLLKKSIVFSWNELEEAAFEALKLALIMEPILALPDFSLTFEIDTNVSDHGIRVLLLQKKHPLAFMSKALGP